MSEDAEETAHNIKPNTSIAVKVGIPQLVMFGGSSSNGCTSSKPDIKVSADGVAKLNFSFLEEAGDSLEPGEVVTPPHSNSPIPTVMTKVIPMSSLAATNVTESQREAQVCKDKVRAILEIDAKKRKEENEKRKQDLEKRRQSGELDASEEEKRKEKAERKRIKRIEKEQRAAKLALMSDNNEDRGEATEQTPTKKKKSKARASEDRQSYESGERVSSSGEEDNCRDGSRRGEHDQSMRSVVNYVAVASNSSATYHHATQSGHLNSTPDAYNINTGFRPMFARHIRPDFQHGRGGYVARGRGGRGGINNTLRHPLYRTPFYGGGPRVHVPFHALPRQPHPNRGHSPIQAPLGELRKRKRINTPSDHGCLPFSYLLCVVLQYSKSYNRFVQRKKKGLTLSIIRSMKNFLCTS